MAAKTIIEGTISVINKTESFGYFNKRTFCVKESDREKYPSEWQLELQHDDTEILNEFKVGDIVKCEVDIIGRRWEKNGRGGIINTLKAWKVTKAKIVAPPAQKQPDKRTESLQNSIDRGQHELDKKTQAPPIDEPDDLPF